MARKKELERLEYEVLLPCHLFCRHLLCRRMRPRRLRRRRLRRRFLRRRRRRLLRSRLLRRSPFDRSLLALRRPDEREVNVYTRACLKHGGVCWWKWR